MPRTIQRAQADLAAGLVVAHDQLGRRIGIDVAPDPGEGTVAHPVPMAVDAGVMSEPGQRIGIGRPDRGEDGIADFLKRHQARLGAGLAVQGLGELGMGQHMVAAGQDERRALAVELDLLEDRDRSVVPIAAPMTPRNSPRTRTGTIIGRIGSPTTKDQTGSPQPGPSMVRARSSSASADAHVLARLRPHGPVGAHEARGLALDRQHDEAHGLRHGRQRAQREDAPLLAVVEIDVAARDGVAEIGELVLHRPQMRLEPALDQVDRQFGALQGGGFEVALRGEPRDADHRRDRDEDQADHQRRQQPRDRPAGCLGLLREDHAARCFHEAGTKKWRGRRSAYTIT